MQEPSTTRTTPFCDGRVGGEALGEREGVRLQLRGLEARVPRRWRTSGIAGVGSADALLPPALGSVFGRGVPTPHPVGGSEEGQLVAGQLDAAIRERREVDRATLAVVKGAASRRACRRRAKWRDYKAAWRFLCNRLLVPRFALELFAGSGRFSRAWRRAANWPIIEIDIMWGDRFDLGRRDRQQKVRGWISAGLVVSVFAAPPLNTWSRTLDGPAGDRPLRSDDHPSGLPGLSGRRLAHVCMDNSLARFCAGLFQLCARSGTPLLLLHPHSHRMWEVPCFKGAMQHPLARTTVLDFCRFGGPWRKRSRVAGLGVDLQFLGRLCRGKQICERSGRRHCPLRSCSAAPPATCMAERLPSSLAALLVSIMQDGMAAVDIAGHSDLLG